MNRTTVEGGNGRRPRNGGTPRTLPALETGAAGGAGIRILLVEDTAADALAIQRHFDRSGMVVEIAWIEGLPELDGMLRKGSWDLVLTDFQLFQADGMDVLRRLQELAPDLPCIIVSGQIGEEAAVRALKAGAKDFVSKANLSRLVPAVFREVEEHRLRRSALATSAELGELTETFTTISNAAHDAIITIGTDGRITFWNQAAQRVFGYSTGEALGQDAHELLASRSQLETFRRQFPGFQATGKGPVVGRTVELWARAKDGREVPVELSLSAIRNKGGWNAIAIVRDISERIAAERARQEQLRFQETLMDTLPNPVYWQDPAGTLLGCNRAFEALLGRDRSFLVGRRLGEVAPELFGPHHAELDQALLETGGTQSYGIEATIGDREPRDLHFLKSTYEGADGRAAGIIAALVDATEQERLVRSLIKSQELFRAITRSAVDLFAIIDGEGHRLYSSPSYGPVLGYEEDEMARRGAVDLLHPDDLDRVRDAIQTLFRDGNSLGLSYRLRHKDGRWLHFESNAVLIQQTETGIPQALVIARDVTERVKKDLERKQMEVQLRHAQKLEAIGQLAAGIAHEINTPTQYIGDNTTFLRDALAELIGFLAWMKARLAEEDPTGAATVREIEARLQGVDLDYMVDEVPRALQQIQEGLARVKKIVGSMKDFSHPGTESKSPADLNRAIESTVTISRNEWKYVAELELDLDPALPPVPCFLGELNQALLNLIVNAAHAIEEKLGGRGSGRMGRIVVSTRRVGEEVEISVADDGPGIPAPLRERIFEPFFTTKAVGRGSGQGLAIVHAVVVEKHHGRIGLETVEGKGSTFRLTLPLEEG